MEGEEDAGRQITRKGVKVNSLANCERGGGRMLGGISQGKLSR